ncbi:MAG: class I SAM-dependent methyltransferase, partial [Solirubrobacterales bacterium]|nr:class I SAM-dependent methyltransferase [Solirubrobacterales bacterium]
MIESEGTALPAPELLASADRLRSRNLPFALELRDPAGAAVRVSPGEPELTVTARTPAGLAVLANLGELAVVEAYLDGDIDIDGDLVRAMELRPLLRGDGVAMRVWSVLEPALRGRIRTNPQVVATHYDSGNVQLLAIDDEYALYTPGVYECDEDTLEEAARRKLERVFAALRLVPGYALLDIGCGWGG